MFATSAGTRPTTVAAQGSARSCDRITLPACRRAAGRNCARMAYERVIGLRNVGAVDDEPADGQVPDDVNFVRVLIEDVTDRGSKSLF